MNKYLKIIITVFIILFFTTVLYFQLSASDEPNFVRAKYGHYCYEEHDYPHEIKYLLYYNSYEECVNSLKK